MTPDNEMITTMLVLPTENNKPLSEYDVWSVSAIHSRCLGLNLVIATASKAKMTLQMSTYDREKKGWNRMYAIAACRRSNKCTQVYATDFGWARVFSMASRNEAHETLLLLFARDGILSACICNNAKEMTQGKFYQKFKDAACHLKQLEPYTPRSNAAEREIKEFKKRAGHNQLRSIAPMGLWDNCLELEAYIRSNIAHNKYKIDGEILKQ